MRVFPYTEVPDGSGGFLPVSPDTPPHTIIEVDALAVAVKSITVLRDDGNTWQRVRGAIRVPVAGSWAGVDWECGFNRATQYRVEQFDLNGQSLGFLPAVSVVLASEFTWVHNPLAPRAGVRVRASADAMRSLNRPYDAELAYPIGRPHGIVVGTGRRGLTEMNFDLVTETLIQADKVQALLGSEDDPLPPIICIRKGANELGARIPFTLFLHVPTIIEADVNIRQGGQVIRQQMIGAQASPPAPTLAVPLLTLDDIDASYATLTALDADNLTLGTIDRRWDLAGRADV